MLEECDIFDKSVLFKVILLREVANDILPMLCINVRKRRYKIVIMVTKFITENDRACILILRELREKQREEREFGFVCSDTVNLSLSLRLIRISMA